MKFSDFSAADQRAMHWCNDANMPFFKVSVEEAINRVLFAAACTPGDLVAERHATVVQFADIEK